MHTFLVISGGLFLLLIFLLIGHRTGAGATKAAMWFVPLWLACAGLNMWVGVARAGYSVVDELPVFAVVFGVPTILALVSARFIR